MTVTFQDYICVRPSKVSQPLTIANCSGDWFKSGLDTATQASSVNNLCLVRTLTAHVTREHILRDCAIYDNHRYILREISPDVALPNLRGTKDGIEAHSFGRPKALPQI